MALLRDARTSAVILEGTPLEVVLTAAELDDGAYLFDDVGEGFDAETVRQAHTENVTGLEGALEEAKAAKDHDGTARLADALEEARAPAEAAEANAAQATAAAEAAVAELEG